MVVGALVSEKHEELKNDTLQKQKNKNSHLIFDIIDCGSVTKEGASLLQQRWFIFILQQHGSVP